MNVFRRISVFFYLSANISKRLNYTSFLTHIFHKKNGLNVGGQRVARESELTEALCEVALVEGKLCETGKADMLQGQCVLG